MRGSRNTRTRSPSRPGATRRTHTGSDRNSPVWSLPSSEITTPSVVNSRSDNGHPGQADRLDHAAPELRHQLSLLRPDVLRRTRILHEIVEFHVRFHAGRRSCPAAQHAAGPSTCSAAMWRRVRPRDPPGRRPRDAGPGCGPCRRKDRNEVPASAARVGARSSRPTRVCTRLGRDALAPHDPGHMQLLGGQRVSVAPAAPLAELLAVVGNHHEHGVRAARGPGRAQIAQHASTKAISSSYWPTCWSSRRLR